MKSTGPLDDDVNGRLDEEFLKNMYEIEKGYRELNKHERIRVEQWTKKLCQITANITWKHNRNHYSRILHHMVVGIRKLDLPFSKIPPDGPLPTLDKSIPVKGFPKIVLRFVFCRQIIFDFPATIGTSVHIRLMTGRNAPESHSKHLRLRLP